MPELRSSEFIYIYLQNYYVEISLQFSQIWITKKSC